MTDRDSTLSLSLIRLTNFLPADERATFRKYLQTLKCDHMTPEELLLEADLPYLARKRILHYLLTQTTSTTSPPLVTPSPESAAPSVALTTPSVQGTSTMISQKPPPSPPLFLTTATGHPTSDGTTTPSQPSSKKVKSPLTKRRRLSRTQATAHSAMPLSETTLVPVEPKTAPSKSNEFRMQGSRFLLTWPCLVKRLSKPVSGDVLGIVSEAFEDVLKKRGVTAVCYILSEEKHENGDLHYHIYLHTKKKMNIRQADFWDLRIGEDSLHGNYKAIRYPIKTVAYVIKDGNFRSFGYAYLR